MSECLISNTARARGLNQTCMYAHVHVRMYALCPALLFGLRPYRLGPSVGGLLHLIMSVWLFCKKRNLFLSASFCPLTSKCEPITTISQETVDELPASTFRLSWSPPPPRGFLAPVPQQGMRPHQHYCTNAVEAVHLPTPRSACHL